MITDPISDMLTRIRNSVMVNKTELVLPYSKIKENICEILKKEGYIDSYEILEPRVLKTKAKPSLDSKFKQIKIFLKYINKKSVLNALKRVSKPGRRVYCQKDQLPVVLNHYGIAILSTSRGLMTNKQAKKEGIGGEVICEIY